MRPRETELFHLPKMLAELQGETHVLFGDAVISTPETAFGAETCEELFTPKAPHIDMALDGVEIITNSSGSHFTLRKLDTRLQLIMEATRKSGGVYLYANQQGCDGERLYFDGCAMIIVNGDVVAQGSQFSLNDVEVVTATVDLEDVRSYRAAISRGMQAAASTAKYQRIQTPFELSSEDDDADVSKAPTLPIQPRMHSVEEEIALCGGCYLWDVSVHSPPYAIKLTSSVSPQVRNRRLSRAPERRHRLVRDCRYAPEPPPIPPTTHPILTTHLPVIVYSMCRIVMQAISDGNQQVIDDVKRIAKYGGEGVLPKTPQELCSQVFTTMKKQSSHETRQRAKDLAAAIGSYHVDLDIDDVYQAQKALVVSTVGFDPKFKVEGGTVQENLTLQCLQARIRMVTAYVGFGVWLVGVGWDCVVDSWFAGVWADSADGEEQTWGRESAGAWQRERWRGEYCS
jgi:NAD+ synthase (glutamine-hydrolysing)